MLYGKVGSKKMNEKEALDYAMQVLEEQDAKEQVKMKKPSLLPKQKL